MKREGPAGAAALSASGVLPAVASEPGPRRAGGWVTRGVAGDAGALLPDAPLSTLWAARSITTRLSAAACMIHRKGQRGETERERVCEAEGRGGGGRGREQVRFMYDVGGLCPKRPCQLWAMQSVKLSILICKHFTHVGIQLIVEGKTVKGIHMSVHRKLREISW
jgi:hypothetical protein